MFNINNNNKPGTHTSWHTNSIGVGFQISIANLESQAILMIFKMEKLFQVISEATIILELDK